MSTTTKSYKTMKVSELKALCKTRKISGYSKLKKPGIITLLENNDQKTSNRAVPPAQAAANGKDKDAVVKKALATRNAQLPQTKHVVKKTISISKGFSPKKLGRKTFPDGHGPEDFECFGPAATKDGEFENTMIVDMGCFKQDGTDSNKYYHGAVVQSKKTKDWYAYFEFARTGASNPDYSFILCPSKESAQKEYYKKMHSKNDKRGQWIDHPNLGRILRAKAKKDCYLVRSQATRSTGLPSAKTIKSSEQLTASQIKKSSSKITRRNKKSDVHPEIIKLMRDLSVGTVKYTKSSMAEGAALPTLAAIEEGTNVLDAAMARLAKLGTNDTTALVSDKELRELTYHLYSRIPKKKPQRVAESTWILGPNNIQQWRFDLDAFESGLNSTDNIVEIQEDPYGGMPIDLEYLERTSSLGEMIYSWMPEATRNRHSYLGNLKIKNVYKVHRHGDENKLTHWQNKIIKDNISGHEIPLHQLRDRADLTRNEKKLFLRTNTVMLFHGTRSVNVKGILSTDLRLPKNLKGGGAVISGAMFGSSCAYFADDVKKSAGYTSLRRGYYTSGAGGISNRGAFMFIADVVLGKPHVASGPFGYTKAPDGCHSVMGKAGFSRVQNNEFMVYGTEQHRLRYLVEFEA